MKVFGTDYDGVIINIEPQKAEAFGILISKYWKVESAKARDYWLQTGGSSRRSKFEHFFSQQYNEILDDNEYKTIEKEFSDLLKNDFYPKVKLLPGALELIKFAKSNFDHTFISSGVPMEEIKYLTELNGVASYFDVILGTDRQFPSKLEHFEKIRKSWQSSKIIFVADGLVDMKIAKKCGVIPIGIPINHSKQELIDAGAVAVGPLLEIISTIKQFIF